MLSQGDDRAPSWRLSAYHFDLFEFVEIDQIGDQRGGVAGVVAEPERVEKHRRVSRVERLLANARNSARPIAR